MAKKRKSRSSVAPPAEESSMDEPQAPPEQIPEPKPEEPIESNQEESEVPEAADPEDEEVEYVDEEVEVEDEDDDEDGDGDEDGDDDEEEQQMNGGGDNEEEEEEEDEDEPFEKLLEPFSNDQLVILIKEAVIKHPDVMESIRKLADADPAHRKIFVHGLGWDTTAETLTSEFGKYGEIEDCKAVTDKVSGKSKGYGFILFKHRSGAKKALKEPQKKIGNRMTSCQLASAGPAPAQTATPAATAAVGPPVSEYTQRKIFVSNVAAGLEPQKLLEFFSKFGEIEEGPLGLDKYTGKPKGFCLFVYKSIEGAKKALEEPNKSFQGHTLHCQRAIDGPKPTKGGNYPQQQQQHYGHQQHQQQYYGGHHHPAKKGKYSGGGGSGGSTGHLMAPAAGPGALGFNPAAVAQGLNPALGQALTALLATQGAVGIGNLLGGLGGPATQGAPAVMNNAAGYGGQGVGVYGQPGMLQGGYQNPQMGSQGGVRPHHQQGGGGYMGHGH